MTLEQKAAAYDAIQIVEKFNKHFPVGSKVEYRVLHDKAPYEIVTVQTPAYLDKGKQPVAFFNELSGYYMITENFINYPLK
jgi:hypothetical protein